MHLKNISKLTNTLKKKKNILVQVFAINKLIYAYLPSESVILFW